MEENNFDTWNKLKQNIEQSRSNNFHIRAREIWYINIGKNIGFESNGKGEKFKRPVIILKRVGSMFFVASMTTKGKNNQFYYKLNKKYFNIDSFITLSQVKIIDQKRFIEKIGKIDSEDYINIKKELKQILF